MTIEIISWSTSTKFWDRARIKLSTPGTAVRHASLVRHAALSTAQRCLVYLSVNHFGSRSALTQCRAWYWSKQLGKAISTCKTSLLVRKKLISTCICIVRIHMNSLWLFGLHMRRMHAHQSSVIRDRLYFVLIGQQIHWRNYIDGRLVLAFAVRIYMWKCINIYKWSLLWKVTSRSTLWILSKRDDTEVEISSSEFVMCKINHCLIISNLMTSELESPPIFFYLVFQTLITKCRHLNA